MSFDTHIFVRPKCDYPGCETLWEGVEYDWIYDEFDACLLYTSDAADE